MADDPEFLVQAAEAAITNSWSPELESAGAGRGAAIALLRALDKAGYVLYTVDMSWQGEMIRPREWAAKLEDHNGGG